MRTVSGAIIFGALGYLVYGAWAAMALATLAGGALAVANASRTANHLFLQLETATLLNDAAAREVVRLRLGSRRLNALERCRLQLSDADDAIQQGELGRAAELLTSLRPSTIRWSIYPRFYEILKESRIAVVEAALGHSDRANGAIATVLDSSFATSSAIARVELAKTMLLEQAGDESQLRAQVERARRRTWLHASRGELAMLSQHRRRLASKTLGTAYRRVAVNPRTSLGAPPSPGEEESAPSRVEPKIAPHRSGLWPWSIFAAIIGGVTLLNGGPLYWAWLLVLLALLWAALVAFWARIYRRAIRFLDATRLAALERLDEAERILEEIVTSARYPIRDHVALLATLKLERGDAAGALAVTTERMSRSSVHEHNGCAVVKAFALAWLDRADEARIIADELRARSVFDTPIVEAVIHARAGDLNRAEAAVADLDPHGPGRPPRWSLLLASLRSVGDDPVEEQLVREELERSPENRAWLEAIAPGLTERWPSASSVQNGGTT